MLRTWTIPLLASALLALSGLASAQGALTDADSRELSVRAQLEALSEAHQLAGYAPRGADILGSAGMAGGEGLTLVLHLEGRVTYLFQGACDQQCTNVDMDIRNSAGEQIAEDINGDDRPVVTITPPRAGEYRLRLWLAQCAMGPCLVGVRTFRRMR